MPPLVLTPEKAFRAIQEMNRRGKRVSGRAVWQQCGEIGSITTAVKWVKVATTITQGSKPVDQDLVDLWESIAQGKDIPTSPPVVHELPQGLRELFERFSQQVAIALQQSVAEETRQTQQTAVSEIEQAEAETTKVQERCQELVKEIEKREAIAQQQDQIIAEWKEKVVSLKARQEELERRLMQMEQQKGKLEKEARERSCQLGVLSEQNKRIELDTQKLQERNSELEVTIQQVKGHLKATHNREQTSIQKCQVLQQGKAMLEAKIAELHAQIKNEHRERTALNARIIALTEVLAQNTNGPTRKKTLTPKLE